MKKARRNILPLIAAVVFTLTLTTGFAPALTAGTTAERIENEDLYQIHGNNVVTPPERTRNGAQDPGFDGYTEGRYRGKITVEFPIDLIPKAPPPGPNAYLIINNTVIGPEVIVPPSRTPNGTPDPGYDAYLKVWNNPPYKGLYIAPDDEIPAGPIDIPQVPSRGMGGYEPE